MNSCPLLGNKIKLKGEPKLKKYMRLGFQGKPESLKSSFKNNGLPEPIPLFFGWYKNVVEFFADPGASG